MHPERFGILIETVWDISFALCVSAKDRDK